MRTTGPRHAAPLFAAAALWLAACGGDATHPDPHDPSATDGAPGQPPTGSLGDGTSASATAPEAQGRDWRRMNINQLEASLERVSGGIVWEEDGVPVLEDLSATLGKPDYAQSTREDLVPNLLFQKFLDDAGTYTCTALLDREATDPANHVFLVNAQLGDTLQTNADAVNANLAYLLLRYHGRSLAPDSDQLEPWRFLFDSTLLAAGGDTKVAWRNVCVGLVTHPDFYTY